MGTRDPFEVREVVSRRGGPTKQPLSRDAIVAEALAQLNREGLAGMSLRKVALGLETGPASLYAYVDDLEELRALVLDRALGAVDLRAPRLLTWRERLMRLLGSYSRVLSDSRGLAQLAMTTSPAGPNAMRIVEKMLGLLDEGGVDQATAAWAVDLILLCVTASAAEHSDGGGFDPAGPAARAVAAVSERDYPRVHAARADLVSGTGEERFAWGIDVLVNGILETARTPRAAGRPAPTKSARAPAKTPRAR